MGAAVALGRRNPKTAPSLALFILCLSGNLTGASQQLSTIRFYDSRKSQKLPTNCSLSLIVTSVTLYDKAFLNRHPNIIQRTTEAVTSASACVSEKDIRK